ncbi:MAG: RNA polymerase sigma factor [Thermoguttaceae bacterium]
MDSDARVQREHLLRRAVLAGDEGAWRTWYNETFDTLYAYVLWRCGSQHDQADEIAQETWLAAVRSIRRFDPQQGNFSAWLRGIAANVMRQQLRRHGRLRKREQAVGTTNAGESRPAERQPDERIALTLDALPERQEAVLRAKYLDGLSVGEIATQWNETPKAVESLLSRARQAFRELFER